MTRILLWILIGSLAGGGWASAQQKAAEPATTVEQLRKEQEALRAEVSRLQAEVQAMQKLMADLLVSTKTAADPKAPAAASGDVSLVQIDKKLDRILAEIQAVDRARPATTQPSRPAALDLIGKAAPAFSLTTIGGIALSNKDFADYPATVLNFVAPNCGFCKRQIPTVENIRTQYQPRGIRFVNVSQKMGQQEFPAAEAQKAYADMGSKLELAIDTGNQVGQLFRANGFPTLVIVDNVGSIKEVIVGAKPNIDEMLRGQLERLAAGTEPQKQAAPAVDLPAAQVPAPGRPAAKTPGTGS
jgi:thiol-disulfide isomerase/thioredoxin